MNPLRLVVLGALFYFGYRMVRSLLTQGRNFTNHDENQCENHNDIRDVLVEDPVCRTLIPKKQAIRLRHHERTYYFCSEACCDSFSKSHSE
ncbi:MAG: YHS domain-containing protein [Desulfobulbaceae bacterium]|nr:YHS domain-containing protein [Desulfobulbaceae bacterium]